jgi:predicted Fe-Mo cluster-binding NifX family protein
MKTVIDAVNEFKGEWKYPVGSVGTDAIYFRFNPKCESYYYYGRDKPYHHEYVCSKDQFNDLVSQMETNFGKCPDYVIYDYKSNKKELLTPSSQPTQIYTQAMADNGGFLPPVNMLVKHEGVKKIVIGELDHNNNLALKSIDNELYSLGHIYDIEPLTPPITLENGKVYQFDYKSNKHNYNDCVMTYNGASKQFRTYKWSLDVLYCTNIQPLTVEVK